MMLQTPWWNNIAHNNFYKFSQPFESTKINNFFKQEVSFVLLSLVAPLSWQDYGIVDQTNILSDSPFHVDYGHAIYLRIGCRL
jgi:hypothetical protein